MFYVNIVNSKNADIDNEKGVAVTPRDAQDAIDLLEAVRHCHGEALCRLLNSTVKVHTRARSLSHPNDHQSSAIFTHYLLLKLCETCDKLPSSLLVTGVELDGRDAEFGGGFADIYRASLRYETVAVKRLRVFVDGPDRLTLHRVNTFHLSLMRNYSPFSVFS